MENYTKVLIERCDLGKSDVLRSGYRYDAMRKELRSRLLANTDFFKPDMGIFVVRCVVNHVLLVAALYFMHSAIWGPRVLGVCVAGFSIVQLVFLAHEVDHGGHIRGRTLAGLANQYFMTVICGYCFSYFQRDHMLHHLYTQEEARDPDTQSALLSLYPRAALEKRGLPLSVTRNQVWLIPILFLFWAFDSKKESMIYVLRNGGKARADQVGLVFHFLFWFVVCGFYFGPLTALINYCGWVAVAGLYLGLTIPTNHVGTLLLSTGERMPFVEQQVRCSRNVAGPRIFDYVFMGLNRQVEHHLFPWVPSTRLRCGAKVVRAFCEERGLPYHEVGYWSALREVWAQFRRMADVARGDAVPSSGRMISSQKGFATVMTPSDHHHPEPASGVE